MSFAYAPENVLQDIKENHGTAWGSFSTYPLLKFSSEATLESLKRSGFPDASLFMGTWFQFEPGTVTVRSHRMRYFHLQRIAPNKEAVNQFFLTNAPTDSMRKFWGQISNASIESEELASPHADVIVWAQSCHVLEKLRSVIEQTCQDQTLCFTTDFRMLDAELGFFKRRIIILSDPAEELLAQYTQLPSELRMRFAIFLHLVYAGNPRNAAQNVIWAAEEIHAIDDESLTVLTAETLLKKTGAAISLSEGRFPVGRRSTRRLRVARRFFTRHAKIFSLPFTWERAKRICDQE